MLFLALKKFQWLKSLLLRFPPPYKLNPTSKISHPLPLRGISPNPIWETLVRGMQRHALSHTSSAIHTA